jgi:uncharacterized membrane protein
VVAAFTVVLVGLVLLFLLIAIFPSWFGFPAASAPRFGLFGGAFFFLLILVLVIALVRVLFWSSRAGRYRGGRRGMYAPSRPEMVARMRYARGEITKEQFDQIMQDLGRGPGGSQRLP